MSAFTKVLIVFVCLLSAIFAASQVVLYTKRENFGELYKQSQQDLRQARADLEKARAEAADWQRKHDAEKARLEGQIASLQEDIKAKGLELARLQAELDKQSASVGRLTEVIEGLRTDIKTKDDTIATLQATLAERNSTVEENLAKIKALMDEGAAKDAKIGKLEDELLEVKADRREIAQEKAQLEGIISDLVARGISIEAVQVPPIDAKVVRVDNELGIAVINRGAKDHVKPNTGFTVFDDEGYVASIVIHTVQDRVSVGRVIRLAEGKQLKIGDSATTTIQ